MVWPLEEGYRRIDSNHCCLRAAQCKRKFKLSTTVGQAATSDVTNGRFILHAIYSLSNCLISCASSHGFQEALVRLQRRMPIVNQHCCLGKGLVSRRDDRPPTAYRK